jgi:hypothetical protein
MRTPRGRPLPECQLSLSGGQDHQSNFSPMFCFRRYNHVMNWLLYLPPDIAGICVFSLRSLADLVSIDSAIASETQRPVLKAVFGYSTTSLIQTNQNTYNFCTIAAVKWCIKRSIRAAELEFSGVSRKRSVLLIEVLRSVLGTVRWHCNLDSAAELKKTLRAIDVPGIVDKITNLFVVGNSYSQQLQMTCERMICLTSLSVGELPSQRNYL